MGPPKGTFLCGSTVFDVLTVKIGAAVSALACRKNPQTKKRKKNEKRSRVKTISRIRGSKTPERIVIKFCMMVGLPDVVTRAKLDGDRFGHFRVVGGRISGFPIDFGSRPYNTLALPCQSMIRLLYKDAYSHVSLQYSVCRLPIAVNYHDIMYM